MTALLQCDGCGQVVGERADDEDPTRQWWALAAAPIIGGGLLPVLNLTMDQDEEPEPDQFVPIEPPRHVCSDSCGETWFRRRREEREAAGPDR